MSGQFEIGPRQTVDRALHPHLGEGRAVYGNGQCAFLADSGAIELLESCSMGGASADRCYLVAVSNSVRLELETTGRQRGDCHYRVMTHDRIRGWLVMMSSPIDEPYPLFFRFRFDGDDGTSFKMFPSTMEVGTPGALERMMRRKNREFLPHEKHWLTLYLDDATHFVYCLERNANDVRWPAPKSLQRRGPQLPGVE